MILVLRNLSIFPALEGRGEVSGPLFSLLSNAGNAEDAGFPQNPAQEIIYGRLIISDTLLRCKKAQKKQRADVFFTWAYINHPTWQHHITYIHIPGMG